jgi:hypothetical protein
MNRICGKLGIYQVYYSIENLVLPPGCKPYGPEVGQGQSSLALPYRRAREPTRARERARPNQLRSIWDALKEIKR